MSTLGRKAMKKTLERLKQDALRDTDDVSNMVVKFTTMSNDTNETKLAFLMQYYHSSAKAIVSIIMYIQALEDYSLELDEAWDRLLKTVEETKQKKPPQRKPSYIK